MAYANAANNLILRAFMKAKIESEKPVTEEDDPFADDSFFASETTIAPPPKLGELSEYGISVWTHPMNLSTAQTAKQGGQVT